MNQPLSKYILYTYFSGNATPLQKQLIAEWLRDARNMEQYYRWLEEWETHHPQFIPDGEQAARRYAARLERNEPPVKPLSGKTATRAKVSPFRLWWVAAALVVLCLTALLLMPGRSQAVFSRAYATAYGEVKTLYLPDGSRVTLNAHSTLYVPRFGFGRRTREVSLEGEAEFSVTHTPDNKRFIVKTPDQLAVEVFGTEFIVNTRHRGTKVVLSQGKVQLRSLQKENVPPLTMQPGDVAEVDETGKLNVLANQPLHPHLAWKDHRFVFNNTSLREIAGQVYERFGVRVEIPDPALANRTLAGTYQADSALELMEVLADLMDLRLSTSNGAIRLAPAQPNQ